jgi:hypothetical protein
LPYSSVRLDIPSSATVGDAVDFAVTGSIGGTKPDWPNFTIGIAYHDGPVNSVKIIMNGNEYRIEKGWALIITSKNVNPGTTLTMKGKVKFESVGKYDLVGVAGYVDEGKGGLIIDSSDLKTVDVSEPGVKFAGVQIPWWALAAAGACVAVIAAVGVVMYIEHEKETKMLMMLSR